MYLHSMARANKHTRKITSFNKIKTIGILYQADTIEEINIIKKAAAKLNSLGKEVYLLGFSKQKKLPEGVIPHTKDDFFLRKDLMWHGIPKLDRINRFANEEFDFLLNAYNPEILSLLGISALSKAKCRIGIYNKKYTNCFDFIISEKETKQTQELIDAFILYLYKLKND